jgi:hypothetical protein
MEILSRSVYKASINDKSKNMMFKPNQFGLNCLHIQENHGQTKFLVRIEKMI